MKKIFIVAFCVFGGMANAMTQHEIKEMSATIINVNGYLCASVTSISPTSSPDVYRVRCVEYRDGSGSASYTMNARTGSVSKN